MILTIPSVNCSIRHFIKVDGPYLITFSCLLPYTTSICEIEIYVCPQMYLKKPRSIKKSTRRPHRFPPPPPQFMLTIEPRMVNKFWACSPISFKHMLFCCPFLDLHLNTHSNMCLIKITGLGPLTLFWMHEKNEYLEGRLVSMNFYEDFVGNLLNVQTFSHQHSRGNLCDHIRRKRTCTLTLNRYSYELHN